jgi:hypothetical protein
MSAFDEYEEHDGTTEAHERRIVRCRTCHAKIVFLPTPGGKQMPVDADTVAPEHERYIAGTHTSHFVTCEQANYHRKRR